MNEIILESILKLLSLYSNSYQMKLNRIIKKKISPYQFLLCECALNLKQQIGNFRNMSMYCNQITK